MHGKSGAPYAAGLLALREGPLLEGAVRALQQRPDLVLVDATGRDHPRRAGLALHLGAVLDLPTIGVTNRPLAAARRPGTGRGAAAPLMLDGAVVGLRRAHPVGHEPVASPRRLAHHARDRPRRAAGRHARWRTPRAAALTLARWPASRAPATRAACRRVLGSYFSCLRAPKASLSCFSCSSVRLVRTTLAPVPSISFKNLSSVI